MIKFLMISGFIVGCVAALRMNMARTAGSVR